MKFLTDLFTNKQQAEELEALKLEVQALQACLSSVQDELDTHVNEVVQAAMEAFEDSELPGRIEEMVDSSFNECFQDLEDNHLSEYFDKSYEEKVGNTLEEMGDIMDELKEKQKLNDEKWRYLAAVNL